MLKKIGYLTVILLLLLGAGFAYLNSSVVSDQAGVIYLLKPGTSKEKLVEDLNHMGVIKQSLLFSLFIHLQTNQVIKTGEYRFNQGSTPLTIWKQVVSGKGWVYHPFVIVPGWTFHQL